MGYLSWNEYTVSDFSPENVAALYERGFVFTRIGKGVMHQTRSVRVNLTAFEPSSENRRILKKVGNVALSKTELPVSEYDWTIGKLAKDFYDTKFGPGVMSAAKVKEMLSDGTRSNFNRLYRYTIDGTTRGFAIAYESPKLVHYSYPFYDLAAAPKDMGLGMMTMTIVDAKASGCRHAYLGSLQRPGDAYKLQFAGLEWFDGTSWSDDIGRAKSLLSVPAADEDRTVPSA